MRIAILFEHYGGYHLARLKGARQVAAEKGWEVIGFEIFSKSGEHPWKTEELREKGGLRCLEEEKIGLVELLDQMNPNAVAIPGWGYSYSREALKWCRKNQVSAIVMSESRRSDHPRVWWKEKAKSFFWVRHFRSALVGGQSHEDYLVQLGMERDCIFRGYDIVDNEFFREKADWVRMSEENREEAWRCLGGGLEEKLSDGFFLTISRFIPRKNLEFLIRSYAGYREKVKDPRDLVILGDGRLKNELENLIQQLRLKDQVFLPGFASYEQTGYWYGLAGALIHPAWSEPWGLVVNEAMAAGLPVLAARACGCYGELVEEGVTGYGFDPKNKEELIEKMIRVSQDNVHDFKKRGREKIFSQFSAEHFGRGLVQAVLSAK